MAASSSSASYLILWVAFALLGTVAADRVKTCQACKELGEAIERNMEKTKARTGPVTIGEGRTVQYERSQMRLGDVLKGVCDEATHQDECNELVSKEEDGISEWFFATPRPDFGSAVCDGLCGEKGKAKDASKSTTSAPKGTCRCPFSRWCPCKSTCDGSAQCCLKSLRQCACKWLTRGRRIGAQYSRYVAQKASKYSRLANQRLDKLPVRYLADKLPLSPTLKRFVVGHWKYIVLTLLVLIATPLYYFGLCERAARGAHVQRSGSRPSRRHARG